MRRAIKQFNINIETVRHLGEIHSIFTTQLTQAVDLSDILRSQIVFAVSALDCFIHDLVRMGMSEIFQKGENYPNSFQNYGISIQVVKRILDASTPNERKFYFEKEIRRLHGYRTFQSSENISQAMGFMGIKQLWKKIGNRLSIASDDVKRHLDLIVDRRNKIAHESDIDPALGIGEKYPIDPDMVGISIDFLEQLADTIFVITMEELNL